MYLASRTPADFKQFLVFAQKTKQTENLPKCTRKKVKNEDKDDMILS